MIVNNIEESTNKRLDDFILRNTSSAIHNNYQNERLTIAPNALDVANVRSRGITDIHLIVQDSFRDIGEQNTGEMPGKRHKSLENVND